MMILLKTTDLLLLSKCTGLLYPEKYQSLYIYIYLCLIE